MRKIINFVSTAFASHYRGGTYQFYPSVNGQTTISTTQTWRDTAAGYNPECTKDHVANQTPSLTTITVWDSRTLFGDFGDFSLNGQKVRISLV